MLLDVCQVSKTFNTRTGALRAVDDVSLSVEPGTCFGLIGESGSGKSTLAGMIAGFIPSDTGHITLSGSRLEPRSRRSRRAHVQRLQLIFQDPRASFNPRLKIRDSLREPLTDKRGLAREEQHDAVSAALARVHLPASTADRTVHAISVGQAQRVAIARALLAEPTLILCDEITSALDVTVQASILELLKELQHERALSILFISHDIAVVAQVADRVAVMAAGAIVEEGLTEAVVTQPQDPYTRVLVEMA